MNTRSTPKKATKHLKVVVLVGVMIIVGAVLAVPINSVWSSSSPVRSGQGKDVGTGPGRSVSGLIGSKDTNGTALGRWTGRFRSLLPEAPPAPLTITTYEAPGCTTAKTSFNLGETVCAKITGAAQPDVDGRAQTRIGWVSPYGSLAQGANIISDPQTGSYAIPASATQTFTDAGGGTVTVDNRGVWRLGVYSALDGSLIATTDFTVHDPTKEYVDLSLHQSETISEAAVGSGSGSVFKLYLANRGPDTAHSVVLTDTVPANTTFTSMLETTSLGFTCGTPDAGVFTCTLAAMPAGATAEFTFAYDVMPATPEGTLIINNANVASSDTPCAPDSCDLQPADNASTATSKVPVSTGAETCTLICHANMSVVANATQGGNPGAFVSFGAASINGSCGAITATFDGIPFTDPPTDPPTHIPASGAFYPVGTTVIQVTSDTGGGSCSFTITVVEGTPPTITCPPDKSATAGSVGGTHTFTAPEIGLPTTNPTTDVVVTYERSDNIQATYDANGDVLTPEVVYSVTDPFPSGTTGINWTVRDSNGLTASCTQTITVHDPCANDTQAPTITAPANITVNTDPNSSTCAIEVEQLGTAEAHDDCSATVTSTGIPSGNLFPVGVTTITYTATDGAGHTATANQTVTVVDNTPPAIVAPANTSYTCLNQVPAAAASASQAHGTNPNIPNGGPVVDNCSGAIVTVSDSSTGLGSVANPLIITRTFTATDTSPLHNSASSVQIITVSDGIAPTITSYPATSSVFANANCQVAVPSLTGSVAANDNCGVAVVITQSPAAGTMVGLGNTPITFFATDSVGNVSSVGATLMVNSPQLTAAGPANMWVGLKNSDDVGTKFDLLAEILRNNVVIASGTALGVSGGSSGFNNAIQDAITMAGTAGVTCGDTLAFRLSVRVAANSGHVSGTARLWYHDSAANSRFTATIGGATNTYYLRDGFVLATTAGPGPKKTIDVLVNRNQNGNPWKPFGTWATTF